MSYYTRNADRTAHRTSEATADTMKQLWAAVIDQAVFDATTRGEEWFDAMDFLMTRRSDTQLAIVGIDPESFRLHLVRAMESTEHGRVNPARRKTFRRNYEEYNERTKQRFLF